MYQTDTEELINEMLSSGPEIDDSLPVIPPLPDTVPDDGAEDKNNTKPFERGWA